ncbi:MAG TPA: hypothetical protein VGL91_02550, partial [Acidobacteriota bacterium]
AGRPARVNHLEILLHPYLVRRSILGNSTGGVAQKTRSAPGYTLRRLRRLKQTKSLRLVRNLTVSITEDTARQTPIKADHDYVHVDVHAYADEKYTIAHDSTGRSGER